MRIAVIGLGYAGLPLCLQFARSGVQVAGIDIDQAKVDAINQGRSYIGHIDFEEMKNFVDRGDLSASSDFTGIKQVEAVIICVPTPLNKNREPDLSYVLNTGQAIAPHLQRGALVVLESTTYPGTTEGELRAVLESGSGFKAGVDFHLAYSPEREDPGNPERQSGAIPKVVSGYTEDCRARACELYNKAFKVLVPVSSCRTAEATKLLENIFRGVNIALVNELKIVYSAMGIDIWEVINAARTKPFGFMPFYPGPGFGGHCIPIDPFYLTWKAREYGQNTRFIELAGEINRLMELLKGQGAEVAYYDPHVPVIRPTREHPDLAGMKSVAWDRKTVESFDLVLISTAHKAVNYRELADWAMYIVDTRNAMASYRGQCEGKLWKA